MFGHFVSNKLRLYSTDCSERKRFFVGSWSGWIVRVQVLKQTVFRFKHQNRFGKDAGVSLKLNKTEHDLSENFETNIFLQSV